MNSFQILINEINRAKLGKFSVSKSFKDMTTLKIGGKIHLVFYPIGVEELQKALEIIKQYKMKYMIIGKGSNIFSSDKYYDGVVISLSDFYVQYYIINKKVTVFAHVPSSKFAIDMSKNNYKDFEFLGTIPGSIGGAITMNAGCYQKSISDNLISCDCLDSKNTINQINKNDLNFGYRSSCINKKNLIVLSATFNLKDGLSNESLNKIKNYRLLRKQSQPQNVNCAGSTFKNPSNNCAWKLIDECGLRGYKINDAKVSDIHANFLLNENNSKAIDMYNLINYVKQNVLEKKGVLLETEWILVNFD